MKPGWELDIAIAEAETDYANVGQLLDASGP